jgi:hypothetical protein
MKDIVMARLESFGTAGQAAKIGKIYNLEDMASRYSASGY